MPIGKTPIERYLLDEQDLETTKLQLGNKLEKPFTEEQLNPRYKKSKKEMIPVEARGAGTISFSASKPMRQLLEISRGKGDNRISMSELINNMVRFYYAYAEHGIEEEPK